MPKVYLFTFGKNVRSLLYTLNVSCEKLIYVAVNGATHFSCVASATHFLFKIILFKERNEKT